MENPNQPIVRDERFEGSTNLEEGIGLCLSGGGYRAKLFHLGVLWRLNEFGYLPRIARISSVSGGSIVSAHLALTWDSLNFVNGVASNFKEVVVEPVRDLADRTIDLQSTLGGVFLPGSVADRIVKAYDKYLFHDKTLQDFTDKPRFVINATNVQSGVLWRFMKPYMRDYRVGEVKNPKIRVSEAVAASSAFPPFLSPLKLELSPKDFTPDTGHDLQFKPYTTDVFLTDGGVYDNLGLETVWKRYRTVLVSDGGGQMSPEPEPRLDWGRHAYRVLNIIDNQVRSLRKRQLIDSFIEGSDVEQRLGDKASSDRSWRKGAYWGMRTNISHYGLDDSLNCPFEKTMELANVPTRLKRLDDDLQDRLINWGYAACDAAMRRHVETTLPAPSNFPYKAGV